MDVTETRAEQRRQIRFAVSLSARLTIGSQRDIPCEIKDFCLGGLFLRFESESAAQSAIGQEGQELKVAFTPPASISERTIEVKGTLVRRGSNGIGIAFLESAREATRVLHKVAIAGRTQRIVASLHPERGGEAVREAAQALLSDAMEVGIQRFGESIEEKLSGASATAQSFNEHNELLQAVNEFKVNFPVVKQRFLAGVLDSIRELETGTFKSDVQAESTELSIVEKAEFEDWLNATSEAAKLEEHFQSELNDVELRLEQLHGYALDAGVNPYSPTRIFHVFSTALESVIQSGKVRQTAYVTLKETLQEPLSTLYQKLDEILPKAQPVARAAAQPATGSAGAATPAAGANQSVGIEAENPASQQAGSPGARGVAANPSSRFENGWGGQPGGATTMGKMAQALMGLFRRNQPRGLAMPGAAGAQPIGVPAGSQLMGTAARPAVGGQPMAPRMGTLSAGPGVPGIAIGAPLPYASKVVQELTVAGAIAPGTEAAVQGSVDVFSTLISAMDAEKSVPSQIRPYFKRLEEPLLKLAIQDPNFFDSAQHPAHRALNAIDRLSLVSSDNGEVKDENLLKLINRWIERIRAEAATNPGIYDEARLQLEKVLEPLLRARLGRIARLQEALEGWQKTSQAKRAITRKIEQRLAGKPVPVVVLDLLNSGWRNYLTRVMLRDTTDHAEQAKAWDAVDSLLEWLRQDSVDAIERDKAHQLLQYLDTQLALVSADRDEQQRVVDRLAENVLYGKDRSRITYTTLKSSHSDDAAAESLTDEETERVNQLHVGDWFTSELLAEPLNLVWIGDDPPLYVFANFRGVKKLDAKPKDLVKRLRDGEFKPTDSLELPLMDRSFSSMVQHMHRSLMRQAMLDPVTGVIRQQEFMRRVRHTWVREGTGDFGFAIGVADFEDLRLYQSELDNEGRTALLIQLAEYLKSKLPDPELLGRCGDRIFAFMLKAGNHQEALELAERLIAQVSKFTFSYKGQTYPLTVNVGLAWSVDCLDPDGLYTKADEACISSKHEGRNQIVLYRDDDLVHRHDGGLVYWASHINNVLSDSHLTLRCQPIMPIDNVLGDPAHFEILLGAPPNAPNPINVGEFVASVERLKRGSELDRWVFATVFDWIRKNPATFDKVGSFSINISGQSIGSKGFFDFVSAELGKGDIPGYKLIFEITESAAIDSFSHAEEFVRHLRRYGCRFSLDDFGVGFSSYSYLKKLKVDYLKIDGSFIRDMLRNEVDVALVSSMNETSRFLGIKTIAESVENEETLTKLREIGVDYVQGYHTGRPIYIDELLKPA
jgi:diguanylate cyclase (GGDEF)-like protein